MAENPHPAIDVAQGNRHCEERSDVPRMRRSTKRSEVVRR
jgi:hypothetical protein